MNNLHESFLVYFPLKRDCLTIYFTEVISSFGSSASWELEGIRAWGAQQLIDKDIPFTFCVILQEFGDFQLIEKGVRLTIISVVWFRIGRLVDFEIPFASEDRPPCTTLVGTTLSWRIVLSEPFYAFSDLPIWQQGHNKNPSLCSWHEVLIILKVSMQTNVILQES